MEKKELKKKLKPFLNTTLASLLSFVVVIIISLPLRAFAEIVPEDPGFPVLLAVCIAYEALFALCLIRILWIRTGDGPEGVIAEKQNGEYKGFFHDIPALFMREIRYLYTFGIISAVCWLLSSADLLITGKQTFSALTLLWFQIFFPAEILPKFLNKILGFAVGPVLCYAVYILLLALFRKRWDRKAK